MTQLSRRTILSGIAAAGAASAAAPFASNLPVQAAAPAVGKQAPGWYRYKVGSFEITVVTDGRTVAPLSDTYVANAPKDQVMSVVGANYLPADKATQLYTPVVINTGSKIVAIDTGLGAGMFEQSKGAVGQYHSNLAASGIDAKAIDTVIISHFHGDHINGLVGAENKPAFPNAEVMVPEVEWAFWADESNAAKVPEQIKPQFGNVKRVFGVAKDQTKYQAGKELVPGIKSIATPGHTPGHMSFIVGSGSDTMIVQSDATAGMAFLFVKNPDWQGWFDADKALAVQSRRKLYDQASADKTLVQGFHFGFPGAGYIEKDGNGYRLVPAPWSPAV